MTNSHDRQRAQKRDCRGPPVKGVKFTPEGLVHTSAIPLSDFPYPGLVRNRLILKVKASKIPGIDKI